MEVEHGKNMLCQNDSRFVCGPQAALSILFLPTLPTPSVSGINKSNPRCC